MYKGQEKHWPTYNVADIAIVVGVLLMALDTFLGRRTRHHHHAAPTPPTNDAPTNPPEASMAAVMIPEAQASGGALEAMPKE